ncbi:probable diaminopimelate decarboxylase, chloroplastic isoform X2 [Penaeus chinensis]|uniref:probable diaminopimelate decarboxylase, chloroplastic isoform X2 n=1 Tax=Penaeus chinensis TaxID=139456 RepID=UPI001FB7E235|nr:probable diaminopimelate decarboxylase, chloroplastic isoform X2 [Penaeus chinensis]
MEGQEVSSKDEGHKMLPVDGPGWSYVNGVLHCDGMSLEDLRMSLKKDYGLQGSPAHIYSYSALVANVKKYTDALCPLGERGVLSYSLKANNNLRVLEALRQAGVNMATTVSGNEILMAMKAGFAATNIIYNGTGKRRWEVELAIKHGVLLNLDSEFDARLIAGVAREMGLRARCIVRLNPALNADTHPYLATALADSKFGVEFHQLERVLQVVRTGESGDVEHVIVEGVHIHVGSAVSRTQVFSDMTRVAARALREIRERGWPRASTINLGGGLNIRLSGVPGKNDERPATPEQLVGAILPLLPEGSTLLLEPGRSLVATAGSCAFTGVLMTEVLGVKTNGKRRFLVVDAAMTEVIRPALYGAHHPVTHVTIPACQEWAVMDVVGPVCESGDFLARRCMLSLSLSSGAALVVWATGAYCSSMASNYNLRPHAIEVIVKAPDLYTVVRRPENFEDLISCYL